ncbi:hypothetical protein, partial [Motilibacter deserti]
VAPSRDADDLAAAILAAHAGGRKLRERTAGWFADNADRRSVRRSAEAILAAYGAPVGGQL